MQIVNDTIFFKSADGFYFKEMAGIKPNTVRFFLNKKPEEAEELNQMIDFENRIKDEILYIEISNNISPHLKFKRLLRDISRVPEKSCWILSWFHDKNGVTAGYNAPVMGK